MHRVRGHLASYFPSYVTISQVAPAKHTSVVVNDLDFVELSIFPDETDAKLIECVDCRSICKPTDDEVAAVERIVQRPSRYSKVMERECGATFLSGSLFREQWLEPFGNWFVELHRLPFFEHRGQAEWSSQIIVVEDPD